MVNTLEPLSQDSSNKDPISRASSISSSRISTKDRQDPTAAVGVASSGAPHAPPNTPSTSQFSSGHKSQLSSSQSSKGLYLLAKGKTTNVLNAIRSKNSATSLRTRVPSHSKNTSASSASAKDVGLSSQSSKGTHSSASSIHDDIVPKNSNTPTITLEKPSLAVPTLSARPSYEKRSPSPSARTTQGNKMHQTSSRLLRMTEDERPYTRDFNDLFATLMVSLPLNAHRVRFQKIDHTFTSEEAINNLGSLKFSQSNRMPDPKDHSRIVTTTTTTTFSMAKEMARSVCQRFMDARFIESADGKPPVTFPLKSAVWQMTPKGMHVLHRFCQRNGISQRHVLDVLDSPRNTMNLVILERDFQSDKLDHDRATVEVIFKRFVGLNGLNVKSNTTVSDSDSVSDYYDGNVGVKMAKERKINDRVVINTFTGKAAVDWLMDCSTTVERREAKEICELFVKQGLIYQAFDDKAYTHVNPSAAIFQPTRIAIYGLTEKGQTVVNGRGRSPANDASKEPPKFVNANGETARDSNTNRLLVIVSDPALRLLFREYLHATHCEENLSFYMEVREFTQNYDTAEKAKMFTRMDSIRESLAAAYSLYNAFLAPGSPCELNIDHNLRNNLAARMTRAVGDDESMLKSLQDVVSLFKQAQTSVFKLMSSDSVPKFLKEDKYKGVLRDHDFERRAASASAAVNGTLPERSLSKAHREPRHDAR